MNKIVLVSQAWLSLEKVIIMQMETLVTGAGQWRVISCKNSVNKVQHLITITFSLLLFVASQPSVRGVGFCWNFLVLSPLNKNYAPLPGWSGPSSARVAGEDVRMSFLTKYEAHISLLQADNS